MLEDSKESVEIESEEEAQGDKVLVDFHNQDGKQSPDASNLDQSQEILIQDCSSRNNLMLRKVSTSPEPKP